MIVVCDFRNQFCADKCILTTENPIHFKTPFLSLILNLKFLHARRESLLMCFTVGNITKSLLPKMKVLPIERGRHCLASFHNSKQIYLICLLHKAAPSVEPLLTVLCQDSDLRSWGYLILPSKAHGIPLLHQVTQGCLSLHFVSQWVRRSIHVKTESICVKLMSIFPWFLCGVRQKSLEIVAQSFLSQTAPHLVWVSARKVVPSQGRDHKQKQSKEQFCR